MEGKKESIFGEKTKRSPVATMELLNKRKIPFSSLLGGMDRPQQLRQACSTLAVPSTGLLWTEPDVVTEIYRSNFSSLKATTTPAPITTRNTLAFTSHNPSSSFSLSYFSSFSYSLFLIFISLGTAISISWFLVLVYYDIWLRPFGKSHRTCFYYLPLWPKPLSRKYADREQR